MKIVLKIKKLKETCKIIFSCVMKIFLSHSLMDLFFYKHDDDS